MKVFLCFTMSKRLKVQSLNSWLVDLEINYANMAIILIHIHSSSKVTGSAGANAYNVILALLSQYACCHMGFLLSEV